MASTAHIVVKQQQITPKACISSIPKELYIIYTKCCISSSRRGNAPSVMRYAFGDDIHAGA